MLHGTFKSLIEGATSRLNTSNIQIKHLQQIQQCNVRSAFATFTSSTCNIPKISTATPYILQHNHSVLATTFAHLQPPGATYLPWTLPGVPPSTGVAEAVGSGGLQLATPPVSSACTCTVGELHPHPAPCTCTWRSSAGAPCRPPGPFLGQCGPCDRTGPLNFKSPKIQ